MVTVRIAAALFTIALSTPAFAADPIVWRCSGYKNGSEDNGAISATVIVQTSDYSDASIQLKRDGATKAVFLSQDNAINQKGANGDRGLVRFVKRVSLYETSGPAVYISADMVTGTCKSNCRLIDQTAKRGTDDADDSYMCERARLW